MRLVPGTFFEQDPSLLRQGESEYTGKPDLLIAYPLDVAEAGEFGRSDANQGLLRNRPLQAAVKLLLGRRQAQAPVIYQGFLDILNANPSGSERVEKFLRLYPHPHKFRGRLYEIAAPERTETAWTGLLGQRNKDILTTLHNTDKIITRTSWVFEVDHVSRNNADELAAAYVAALLHRALRLRFGEERVERIIRVLFGGSYGPQATGGFPLEVLNSILSSRESIILIRDIKLDLDIRYGESSRKSVDGSVLQKICERLAQNGADLATRDKGLYRLKEPVLKYLSLIEQNYTQLRAGKAFFKRIIGAKQEVIYEAIHNLTGNFATSDMALPAVAIQKEAMHILQGRLYRDPELQLISRYDVWGFIGSLSDHFPGSVEVVDVAPQYSTADTVQRRYRFKKQIIKVDREVQLFSVAGLFDAQGELGYLPTLLLEVKNKQRDKAYVTRSDLQKLIRKTRQQFGHLLDETEIKKEIWHIADDFMDVEQKPFYYLTLNSRQRQEIETILGLWTLATERLVRLITEDSGRKTLAKLFGDVNPSTDELHPLRRAAIKTLLRSLIISRGLYSPNNPTLPQ